MQSWNTSPLYGYNQPQPYPSVGHFPSYQGDPPLQAPPAATPFEQFARPPFPMEWSSSPYQEKVTVNPQWNGPPKGILYYFQDKNGELDIDKMLGTVGQVANTYHQVAPLFKGIGSLLKGINR